MQGVAYLSSDGLLNGSLQHPDKHGMEATLIRADLSVIPKESELSIGIERLVERVVDLSATQASGVTLGTNASQVMHLVPVRSVPKPLSSVVITVDDDTPDERLHSERVRAL